MDVQNQDVFLRQGILTLSTLRTVPRQNWDEDPPPPNSAAPLIALSHPSTQSRKWLKNCLKCLLSRLHAMVTTKSNFKRAMPAGQAPLAALRNAQMVEEKAILPAGNETTCS